MSKFDTIRNFLEEVADSKNNEDALRALNLVYQNAQEIISCYPDIATFLINVTNAVETFPMKRVLQAKKAIKENKARFFEKLDDDDDDDESLAPVYKQEIWGRNINHRLRTALKKQLGMPPDALNTAMKKIDSAQGIDYTKGETFAFVQSRRAAGDLYLKATACNGDTYYLVKTYLRYVILIQDPDLSGTLYEVNR